MRKLILSLAFVLTASLSVAAQDIIILRNSERIDARIVEVTSTEIAYTLAGDGSGEVFRLSVAEIASIMYGNGDVQTFEDIPVTETYNADSDRQKERLTPKSKQRIVGLSIGYSAKRLVSPSYKGPWIGDDEDGAIKTNPSLKAGLYWAPEFKYGIGLQGGVYYEWSTYVSPSDAPYSVEISEHTVSFPLRVQYRYEILKDLSVFAYTGPSFDVSVEYKTTVSAFGMKETLYEYGEYSDLRQFNLLWGVGIGVRYNCVQLMMGGDWGLIDISKSTPAKLNKPFFVTLSYVF